MLTTDEIKAADLGDPTDITIARDGDLDMRLNGWLTGSGSTYNPVNNSGRWVDVSIYLTTGGYIVAACLRRTQWDGESDTAQAYHGAPRDVLAWLVADGGGYLGPASKEAYTEACAAIPALADEAVETVD